MMKALFSLILCCSLFACGGGRSSADSVDGTDAPDARTARRHDTTRPDSPDATIPDHDAAPPAATPDNLIDLLPLAASGHFTPPREDGPWRRTYPDGSVWEEGRFEDGLMVGEFTRYYPDGQRSLHTSYVAGHKHGSFTSWYANGQIFEQGQYIAGQRDGTWTSYYETGQILEESVWKRGHRMSVTTHLIDGKTVTTPITGSPISIRGED